MMLVKHLFALCNKCRYHHHKQILTHPLTFIAKILFWCNELQLISSILQILNFIQVTHDYAMLMYSPWQKESMPWGTRNTFLQNQNKSSCIYKYVTIHLFLGIKWWVCAMQTNTGLCDIIAVGFFLFYLFYVEWKKSA